MLSPLEVIFDFGLSHQLLETLPDGEIALESFYIKALPLVKEAILTGNFSMEMVETNFYKFVGECGNYDKSYTVLFNLRRYVNKKILEDRTSRFERFEKIKESIHSDLDINSPNKLVSYLVKKGGELPIDVVWEIIIKKHAKSIFSHLTKYNINPKDFVDAVFEHWDEFITKYYDDSELWKYREKYPVLFILTNKILREFVMNKINFPPD